MIGFDLYNLFNSNPTLTWDQNYGVNYLRPTGILMPRFVRFNATVVLILQVFHAASAPEV